MRARDSVTRSNGRRPVATACRTAPSAISAAERPSGNRSSAMSARSTPAASVRTAARSMPYRRSIAPIRRSSLTTTPSKPSRRRSSPVMVGAESVAG